MTRVCLSPGCSTPTIGLYCTACNAGRKKEPTAASAASSGRREPNKTELRFKSDYLRLERHTGLITRYEYESLKFRLAEIGCWYTPDWVSWLSGGRIRIDEVKGGRIEEDARVKFKVAAGLFPEFHWRMWQWSKGTWRVVYDIRAADNSAAPSQTKGRR